MLRRTVGALLLFVTSVLGRAQTADPQLLAEINQIKAIDNH